MDSGKRGLIGSEVEKNEDIIGAVVPCPVKSPSDHLTSLRGPGQGMWGYKWLLLLCCDCSRIWGDRVCARHLNFIWFPVKCDPTDADWDSVEAETWTSTMASGGAFVGHFRHIHMTLQKYENNGQKKWKTFFIIKLPWGRKQQKRHWYKWVSQWD